MVFLQVLPSSKYLCFSLNFSPQNLFFFPKKSQVVHETRFFSLLALPFFCYMYITTSLLLFGSGMGISVLVIFALLRVKFMYNVLRKSAFNDHI